MQSLKKLQCGRQAISFSDFLPPVTFWSPIWPFVFLFFVAINSFMGEAPCLGVVPAGVVEHEPGLGIVVFAGNTFEAVGGQCAGEHAAEGVPEVSDGVFSQVVGEVAYAAQGVIMIVQQASTGSEVAVAPLVFSVFLAEHVAGYDLIFTHMVFGKGAAVSCVLP